MTRDDPLKTTPPAELDRDNRVNKERRYVIPTSCWRPREGTGIPADAQMYPPLCPDPEYCRANRCCFWRCNAPFDEGGA